MSNSVSSPASTGGNSSQSPRSWAPSGFGHHEPVESRGCVMTSLSDDRIISADGTAFWSPF